MCEKEIWIDFGLNHLFRISLSLNRYLSISIPFIFGSPNGPISFALLSHPYPFVHFAQQDNHLQPSVLGLITFILKMWSSFLVFLSLTGFCGFAPSGLKGNQVHLTSFSLTWVIRENSKTLINITCLLKKSPSYRKLIVQIIPLHLFGSLSSLFQTLLICTLLPFCNFGIKHGSK